jgi:hypothetical protein
LKDASAISEYGSRGSNGIVVKTKRASFSDDKTTFRYSTQYGISFKVKILLQNARQLLTLKKIWSW